MFLTAYLVDDQDVIAGYGAGGVDYLTKPVNPQILRHKVAVFAELFRKTRELAEANGSSPSSTRASRSASRRAPPSSSGPRPRCARPRKQKDEFLAVLAHELRNPLAPLRTGIDLLLRLQDGSPRCARKTLAAMGRQLDHMVRLVDDLLDISRISRGFMELKKRARRPGRRSCAATLDSVRPLFERRDQVVSLSTPPSLLGARRPDARRADRHEPAAQRRQVHARGRQQSASSSPAAGRRGAAARRRLGRRHLARAHRARVRHVRAHLRGRA